MASPAPRIPTISGEVESAKAMPDASHDYEHVLDLIGFGRTQWLILFTSGLLLMTVINETVGINMITLTAQCDLEMQSMDKALLGAASFIGILLSSYFWGYFSDNVGRRPALLYSTFLGNLASFISMFIPIFWLFVLMRVLVGFFIAGSSSTVYAYLGEFYTVKLRAVVINYASMFVGISMIYVPAVAWGVLDFEWCWQLTETFKFRPWRLLILFNLLPGFIGAIALIFLPESPKLLLSLRKDSQAFQAVEWICKCNTGYTLSHFDVYKLNSDPLANSNAQRRNSLSGTSTLKRMWQETRPLFKKPHVWNFINSCVIMFIFFFSSTGMGLWYPDIQNRLNTYSNDHPMSVCEIIDSSMHRNSNTEEPALCSDYVSKESLIDSMWVGGSYVIGYIVLGVIVKVVNRKIIISSFMVGGFLCILALNWLMQPIAIVVCFCLFLMMPGLMISVLSGAVVDLVPTHLRGKAVCICLMLGRSGSIFGSNMVGSLLETNCTIAFAVFAVVALLCAGLSLQLPI